MRLSWPAVCCALLLLPACVTVEERPGVSMSERSGTATAQLRSQVDEMRYLHGQELMERMHWFATLGDDATEVVCEGTKSDDWLVRASCLWVLGAIGDRRNVPAAFDAIDDPVSVVRYQAASTLVKLGDGRGFRTLVDGLADGDLQNRYKCFQALKLATGRDFGYRHDAVPDERRQAVTRWMDWLDGIQASAL